MIQAPSIRELTVTKLAANFAQIQWDTVGQNFRYEVHIRTGQSATTLGNYRRVGYTESTHYFFDDDTIQPNSYYQFRVRTVYKNFENGEFTESDVVISYDSNTYIYSTQDNFILSNPFTEKFFKLNDKTYIDVGNDDLYATLVRPDYEFDPTMEYYDEAGEFFVKNSGFQVVYPKLPVVCHSEDRVIPSVIDDVIYAFERYQSICKVSNDGGESWNVYNAFVDRIGNPVENCIAQQNSTNTFVLGYNYIFQGIPTDNLTFDNTTQHWSTIEYSFENLNVENSFGFDTERFTPLATLPPALKTKAESFNADDYQLVVAAEDKLYEYSILSPRIESDTNSSDYGSRVFNTTEYRVTGNDDAVMKKIVAYSDPDVGTDVGTFYILVTGQWVRNESGQKMDVDDTVNWRGVYRMNRTVVTTPNPDYDPDQDETDENPQNLITGFVINGFSKVYGNTDEQLSHITKDSTLSRDETHLILGITLHGWKVVNDNNPPDGASSAVRFYKRQLYTSRQVPRKQVVGTRDGITWSPYPQDYYGSSAYNWMQRSGTRDYKDWEHRLVYVRPDTVFTIPFDQISTNKWTYEFSEGTHVISAPNLTISDFDGYTDGALIHNQVGRMLGYLKFRYRDDSPVAIDWIPARHVLTANLVDYTPTVVEVDKGDPTTIVDPDLITMTHHMIPEAYIPDDGLFKTFCDYYMKFISSGSGTAYNQLYNLLNSQNNLDEHSVEYLYSEFYSRNQILDADKREAVTRFFLSRQSDFYSTKGIINSYKFLFKLLYNEDVELEVESMNTFEYYITVDSNDITDDMVGRRIYTDSGSADITYYERVYEAGKLYWKLTLNNLIGKFNIGQVIRSGWDATFSASVLHGVRGSATIYNSEEFKNRSSSYYVMKIKSELQATQYRDDVIRFVHPVGFGFLGITLLTVLINEGLSVNHVETIVDMYDSIRFDQGAGTIYPDLYPSIDRTQDNPELQYDEEGKLIEIQNPKGGFDVLNDRGVTESEYNDYWNNDLWYGTLPYDRRSQYVPSWDASWMRYSEVISRESKRLKDNIGNWYDPDNPTQKRIQED